ncbi:MAG: ABC transporter permease [Planctomycetes bacterium]|nr:ABC transporter permease [Planctomycetota bacterium]
MRMVPLTYPLRSVAVRWRISLFAAFGIACTVAVMAGILSLRSGFESLYQDSGSDLNGLYMRPGATSEGESGLQLERVRILQNERPEIARNADGQPLAAAESYVALNLARVGGGTTNVPLRGISEHSIAIQGDSFSWVDGEDIKFGADELIVGDKVSGRIANCKVGDTLTINLTPFRVVGIFAHTGPYSSEIWGDVDRLSKALDREVYQRVIARLKPGTVAKSIVDEIENDKRAPAKFETERRYFKGQTQALGGILFGLATFISTIMGIAAVLGATTTMLASIGSRSREVGILLALGFARGSIFVAFLIESLIVGVVGGLLGCLAVLPFNGLETGTTNFQTFTEVSFAFLVTPSLLVTSFSVAVILGIVGGVVPAWRAASLTPTQALRRH